MFRIDAWKAFYREVLSVLDDDSLADSDHGLDQVWCAMLHERFPNVQHAWCCLVNQW